MSFWSWFQANGDKIFTFIALAAAAVQGQGVISPPADKWALIAGVLATAAHQSFFPTQQPAQPAGAK